MGRKQRPRLTKRQLLLKRRIQIQRNNPKVKSPSPPIPLPEPRKFDRKLYNRLYYQTHKNMVSKTPPG